MFGAPLVCKVSGEFLDVVHQRHILYQILYNFLMIVEPSNAQHSSFLICFWSVNKNTPKGTQRDTGTIVHTGKYHQ